MLDGTNMGCLQRLCDLAAANESWLVERVMARAREAGYSDHTPQSPETWRDAVRGLTDTLFQAVYAISDGYAEGPARHDPVVAYGVVRARTHSVRHVTPAMWTGMLQCYRNAYLDLLALDAFDPAAADVCRRFIDRVFDRFANGFHSEWAALANGGHSSARDAGTGGAEATL